MKKLNATNAIAILSLGLMFSVVVAGCGGGNDTGESAVTKNAKAGSSDGGAGGGTTKSDTKAGSSDGGAGGGTTKSDTKTGSSDGGAGGDTTKSAPTTEAKTGSSDGGTGKSVTVSGYELANIMRTNTLTNAQMNTLTSAQWYYISPWLSASQVASIPTKTIQNLSTTVLEGLSALGTAALTDAQLNSMSTEQLNALVSSGELTVTQLVTVNKKLGK